MQSLQLVVMAQKELLWLHGAFCAVTHGHKAALIMSMRTLIVQM
jgi:hypothetical protein